MLKPRGFLARYAGLPAPLSFATAPAPGGLLTVYVIDDRGDLTFISRGMLEAWGMHAAALHRLATGNLTARCQGARAVPEPAGAAPAVMESVDGYDATRLLVAAGLLAGPPERYLLGVPDEHLLMVFARPEPPEIPRLAAEVRRRHAAARLPLSPALFTLTAAGPAVLRDPGTATPAESARSS